MCCLYFKSLRCYYNLEKGRSGLLEHVDRLKAVEVGEPVEIDYDTGTYVLLLRLLAGG